MTDNSTPKPTLNPYALILSLLSGGGLLFILVMILLHRWNLSPLALWGWLAVLITLMLVALGLGANGKWYGVLIDSRNRTSLSRLQMTLWTILAISAFLAMALPRSNADPLEKQIQAGILQCKQDFVLNYFQNNNLKGLTSLDELRQSDPAAASLLDEQSIAACRIDPLNITFPPELLLALGISTTSFAGSALIQSNKKNRPALSLISDQKKKVSDADARYNDCLAAYVPLMDQVGSATAQLAEANKVLQDPNASPEQKSAAQVSADQAQAALDEKQPRLSEAEEELDAARKRLADLSRKSTDLIEKTQGVLKVNPSPRDATLFDMFQGDESGDYNLIDLSKVQMFFFTVAIIVAYGAALASMFRDSAALLRPGGVDFPVFSTSLNALLAISHAGYLSVKSIGHTPTQPTNPES